MRILVVDFAGHPFQAELSRGFARLGHEVRHACVAHFVGPKATLRRTAQDPRQLSFVQLASGRLWRTFLLGRLWVGVRFGAAMRTEIRKFKPDVVITSNVPPEALLIAGLARLPTLWVWWVQDLLTPGAERVLKRRSKILASLVSSFFRFVERRLAKGADAIVIISESFKPYIDRVGHSKLSVVHNWAPLHELPMLPKTNHWSNAVGVQDTFNYVYTGTLGMKHDPELLVKLAKRMELRPNVRVVVVSEGRGADYLKARVKELGLNNLLVLPFQPYSQLPEVMGAADVLVAILEKDAGVFSVPSKVLSYHCAGRPILASVPLDNLAAEIINSVGSGFVSGPDDTQSFIEYGERLLAADKNEIAAISVAARHYAEENFHINKIVQRFVDIIEGARERA